MHLRIPEKNLVLEHVLNTQVSEMLDFNNVKNIIANNATIQTEFSYEMLCSSYDHLSNDFSLDMM